MTQPEGEVAACARSDPCPGMRSTRDFCARRPAAEVADESAPHFDHVGSAEADPYSRRLWIVKGASHAMRPDEEPIRCVRWDERDAVEAVAARWRLGGGNYDLLGESTLSVNAVPSTSRRREGHRHGRGYQSSRHHKEDTPPKRGSSRSGERQEVYRGPACGNVTRASIG